MNPRLTLRTLDNPIEANLLLGLLQQQGLRVWLLGEQLLGAVGELPAAGLLRLVVDAEDEAVARQVLADWDAATPLPEPGLREADDGSEDGAATLRPV
ncbi:DUF2007 domain-containing protein [Roseateles sp. DAIF2]|uniref:putative signal transducing protein n=1 Tax=Roseateles sp. DAIF2 TaxID=2714952 RepID=UPI0018A2A7ED|nr:DUF2007 domain-containing protein [Roseateles sp. DAIF2]QPF76180.1 DUF2007 domain-containing protein [Roseateles sp. DAIF2]